MSKISLDLKEEQNIIKKAKRNRDHFAPLYKHYRPHIEKFFKLRLKDRPETIEDLTSEVFKKAIDGLDNFQWQGISFSAWIYRIARNTLIDHFRSQKKDISLDSIQFEFKSKEKGPEELTFEYMNNKVLKELLKSLPERERDVIYMKFFEGYTNKAISKLLKLSETNVSTIVYRSVNKLKKKLFEY